MAKLSEAQKEEVRFYRDDTLGKALKFQYKMNEAEKLMNAAKTERERNLYKYEYEKYKGLTDMCNDLLNNPRKAILRWIGIDIGD